MLRKGTWLGALVVLGLLLPACVTAYQPPPGHRHAQVVVGTTFFEVLSPYGEWFVLEPFGTVWRPYSTVVGVEFVPYASGGYWVHTDAGWAFESGWRWGWTVFHYGHWVWVEGPGWVWVPGTEWAPAWVQWRYGGGYVGWYPMPPPHVHVSMRIDWGHWIFVPAPYFTHRDFHRYVVPHHDRYRAYHEATPVGLDHGRPVGPPRQRLVREHRVTIPEGRVSGPRQVTARMLQTPAGIPVRDARSFESTPPGAVVRERERTPDRVRDRAPDRAGESRERWTQPEPQPGADRGERRRAEGSAEPQRGRSVDRGQSGDPAPDPAQRSDGERPRDRTVQHDEQRSRDGDVDRGERPQTRERGTPPARVRPREERGTGGSGPADAPKRPTRTPTKTRRPATSPPPPPPPPPQRGDR